MQAKRTIGKRSQSKSKVTCPECGARVSKRLYGLHQHEHTKSRFKSNMRQVVVLGNGQNGPVTQMRQNNGQPGAGMPSVFSTTMELIVNFASNVFDVIYDAFTQWLSQFIQAQLYYVVVFLIFSGILWGLTGSFLPKVMWNYLYPFFPAVYNWFTENSDQFRKDMLNRLEKQTLPSNNTTCFDSGQFYNVSQIYVTRSNDSVRVCQGDGCNNVTPSALLQYLPANYVTQKHLQSYEFQAEVTIDRTDHGIETWVAGLFRLRLTGHFYPNSNEADRLSSTQIQKFVARVQNLSKDTTSAGNIRLISYIEELKEQIDECIKEVEGKVPDKEDRTTVNNAILSCKMFVK